MDEESHDFNEKEVENILREALKLKLKENKKLPSKAQVNRALTASISEFLACYKLIGYDLEGNPIKLTITNSNMEKSAIDNAFMEEVGKFLGDR